MSEKYIKQLGKKREKIIAQNRKIKEQQRKHGSRYDAFMHASQKTYDANINQLNCIATQLSRANAFAINGEV